MEVNTIAMLISFLMRGHHYAFLLVRFGSGVAPGLGTKGIGHVMSLAMFVEQNGRISSYKYHCRFASRPFGWIAVGLFALRDEALTPFLKMLISFSVELAYSLTVTIPGFSLEALK